MKNPAFAYARPTSLAETLDVLSRAAADGEDAKILAGGQSFLPVLAIRLGAPDLLVDIGHLPDLDRIRIGADRSVTIGALVRHAQVEDSSEVAARAPLVSAAAPLIGHRAIRNRGTTVGSIAHGDPAAEMPAVCLATGATMVAASVRGEREIPADEFFLGFLETALEPDEILVRVRFPAWPRGAGAAMAQRARRHGDYALVGVAVKLVLDDGPGRPDEAATITEAALAYYSVGTRPMRIPEIETTLVGRPAEPAVFAEAARVATEVLQPGADGHASANYRRHLAGVLTGEGLAAAAANARAAKDRTQEGTNDR